MSGLAGASTVGQALALMAAPVITRLYAPEQFASYALIAAVAAFIGAAMSGRLETAIPLPETNQEGSALTVAAVLLATVVGAVVAASCLWIPGAIAYQLGDVDLQSVVWLIPLVAYFQCSAHILTYHLIRARRYRPLGINTLIESVTSTGTQIGAPLGGISFSGLLLSLAVTPVVATCYLFRVGRQSLQGVSLRQVRETVSKYREYPLYGTPISVVNSAVSPLVVWFIFRTYGAETAGLYALALRVLVTPAAVLQEAIRKVFWGEITETTRKAPERAVPLFYAMLWKLLLLGAPCVVLTMIYAEPIVATVFGESWIAAGHVIAVLAPMAAISLATTALANFSMIGKPKLGLAWASLQLTLVVGIFAYSEIADLDFESFLVGYACVMTLSYLIQVVMWVRSARTLALAPNLGVNA